jgi:cytochrome oxidase Cu insertion factor (SCO1/SenC/PrrC family)
MQIINAAVLGAGLVSLLPANCFAHSPLPFKILSTSIGRTARHRVLPDFSLIERSGKQIGLADLSGKVWIADFIYTHCPDTCPMQTADMAKLQDRWAKEIKLKLVSFSVDPERDTPAVLSEYAKRFKADSNRWLFLTGTKKEITHLLEDGFHLLASSAPHGNHGMILHSSRFVLIDWQGQVRGHYDNRDPKAMGRLEDDVTRLLKHEQLARDVPNAGVLSSDSGISR